MPCCMIISYKKGCTSLRIWTATVKKIKRLECHVKAYPTSWVRTTCLCKEVIVFPNYYKVQDCSEMSRPLWKTMCKQTSLYLLELISHVKCSDPGLQWLQSITTLYFHWSYLALENTYQCFSSSPLGYAAYCFEDEEFNSSNQNSGVSTSLPA